MAAQPRVYEKLQDNPSHPDTVDRTLVAFETQVGGLDEDEVRARLRRYGPNQLPRKKLKSIFAIYFVQFKSAFIYLLLAAAAVTVALGESGDAVFILLVLQFNALVGSYQEWQAQQRVEALRDVVPRTVRVRRSGEVLRVDTEKLVPGDVVLVSSGDQVPADLRICESKGLRADESLLTGESVPADKVTSPDHAPSTRPSDRPTLLLAGTTIVSGRGEGVVVATGAGTEVGKIAEALAQPGDTAPPLLLKMASFTRTVSVAMLGMIGLIAAIEAFRGVAVAEIFLVAVALAVAAIPEGLPVAITIALSISVTRMARRNVVVRRLYAVEGLGACTLIASDKTGTLTCNEMTVRKIYLPEAGELTITGEGYELAGSIHSDEGSLLPHQLRGVKELARAAAQASEAALQTLPDGSVTPIGDSVDAAFHVLLNKVETQPEHKLPTAVFSIPYEPELRYAASFYEDGDELRAVVKGAWETVDEMCGNANSEATSNRAEIMRSMNRLAERGFRVLAVADGPVVEKGKDGLRDLRFLGLVGLIDPLRPEAVDAVAACQQAGVEVRMITGDHPTTALAISLSLGIAEKGDEVVTGPQLDSKSANNIEFDELVEHGKVFARIEPLTKLAVVESLKRAGHFVAVTGDGVNDAPALRSAHIGAAMGRSGTDVAREASDLIVADDNFASIVAGIEEGRVAYGNIRKVIYLLISTGSAEIALFLFSLAAGYPAPLTAVQLLWLNLVTQGAQHVGLAFEKAEGVLRHPPRDPKQGIFDPIMIRQTIVSGLWMGGLAFAAYVWLSSKGLSSAAVGNNLLLLLVLFENAHVLNCRSETRSIFRIPFLENRVLLAGVVIAQGLHLIAMQVPGLREVLEVSPVDVVQWLYTCLAASSVVVVMELAKAFWREEKR